MYHEMIIQFEFFLLEPRRERRLRRLIVALTPFMASTEPSVSVLMRLRSKRP